jgi:tetrahydromethanopterin S-methyltransferase subunit H
VEAERHVLIAAPTRLVEFENNLSDMSGNPSTLDTVNKTLLSIMAFIISIYFVFDGTCTVLPRRNHGGDPAPSIDLELED